MADDREFEVIDKRRVKAETAEGSAPGSGGSTASEQPATTEGETAPADDSSTGAGVSEEELRAAMEEAAASGVGGAEGAEWGADAGPAAEAPPLDLPTALSFCVNMLNEVAWMKMGLIPNPLNGKVERDLTQAKAAIDAVSDLVPRLEPFIPEAQRRDLQVMLSNLRINFVQQSQKG